MSESRPTTAAGRKLITDLWGAEPEGEIAKIGAQAMWWTGLIRAIEAEATSDANARIAALVEALRKSAAEAQAQIDKIDDAGYLTGEKALIELLDDIAVIIADSSSAQWLADHDAEVARQAVEADTARVAVDLDVEVRKRADALRAEGAKAERERLTGWKPGTGRQPDVTEDTSPDWWKRVMARQSKSGPAEPEETK